MSTEPGSFGRDTLNSELLMVISKVGTFNFTLNLFDFLIFSVLPLDELKIL